VPTRFAIVTFAEDCLVACLDRVGRFKAILVDGDTSWLDSAALHRQLAPRAPPRHARLLSPGRESRNSEWDGRRISRQWQESPVAPLSSMVPALISFGTSSSCFVNEK
jgi:hypothetical protein